jgi:hypothetical protein
MVSSWHVYQMNARSVDVHNGNPEILYSFQSISVPGYISEQYIHHRQSSAYMSDDRDAKTLGRPRGVLVPNSFLDLTAKAMSLRLGYISICHTANPMRTPHPALVSGSAVHRYL